MEFISYVFVLNKSKVSRSVKMNFDVNSNPGNSYPDIFAIPSAGDDLYIVGLSLFLSGSFKRVWFHNPVLVFVINFQLLIRCIASATISINNEYLLLVVGDIGHFFGSQIKYQLIGHI